MRKYLIFLVAVAFLAVSAMPAMADFTLGGTVQQQNWWTKTDGVATGTGHSKTIQDWALSGPGTYLDFKFKKGDIGGRFTIRPHFGSNSYAYGTWNFGAGTLLVGNAMNLTFNGAAQAAKGSSKHDGNWTYNIRSPQVALTFPVGGGKLSVAAAKPAITGIVAATTVVSSADIVENVLPRFEAKYDIKFGKSQLKIAGNYQTYDEVDTATNKSWGIDSYMIGAYYSVAIGNITFKSNLWTASNLRMIGGSKVVVLPVYDTSTGNIEDASSHGWHISAGYKLNDMVTLKGGVGGIHHERDPITGQTSAQEDDNSGYYINMPISITKGLTLTPEIGVSDNDDATSTDRKSVV